jgi:ABC-type transporter Mla subunit MlaD
MKAGLTAGIFVLSAVILFTLGLYMIGDSHNLFAHHVDFYTELSEVNGLSKGMIVQVAGFPAGQVLGIAIPNPPFCKIPDQIAAGQ